MGSGDKPQDDDGVWCRGCASAAVQGVGDAGGQAFGDSLFFHGRPILDAVGGWLVLAVAYLGARGIEAALSRRRDRIAVAT